ncbi:hypothetical protein [Sphaerisporangium corydalis]|uniref:ATP-binding protein n=1 Tax=Sphaerisporangium corydalis TaxID=1441875 RepID=A0ABV9ER85_9ACTN|nr:hypothetical protein [Sphaerisporangium corydalis]
MAVTTVLHQASYSWQRTRSGTAFGPVRSTLAAPELQRVHRRIEHWLRTSPSGSPGLSHFYGNFDRDAVFVRRVQPRGGRSAISHLLVGPSALLTPRLALELRDWQWLPTQGEHLAPLEIRALDQYRVSLDAEAHSPEALARLTPLLSHVLATGEGVVELPPSDYAYSLLWGLQAILDGLAFDLSRRTRWKLTFETYDDRPALPSGSGVFVRFRTGAKEPASHPVYASVADQLVATYTHRSAAVRAGADPDPHPSGAHMPSPVPVRPSPASVTSKLITCPICASTVDWADPALYRYDPLMGSYAELTIPATASDTQRAQMMRTAFVRCVDPEEPGSAHYLPLAYGQYGAPAVYGFIGATKSGKTHLLTAMIGQMEKHGLGFGLRHRPLTLAGHKSLIDEQVSPFLNKSQVIEQTRLGTVGLVDVLLIRDGEGEARPIALFDVAGGDLLEIEAARKFLDVVDGLIFVVNAAELGQDELGDRTFNTVLELLEGSGRLAEVSAAVVLCKADLLRFDDPVTLWMRQEDRVLDAQASLNESADVYAYLRARDADAWTRPYREGRKATLHVASATGSDIVVDKTFVRGVRPCRVLNPLISLMAMTGVLTSPEARKIGI